LDIVSPLLSPRGQPAQRRPRFLRQAGVRVAAGQLAEDPPGVRGPGKLEDGDGTQKP
jgi:hypothetical protein